MSVPKGNISVSSKPMRNLRHLALVGLVLVTGTEDVRILMLMGLNIN